MRWFLLALLCVASAVAFADGFGADGFVQTTGGGAPPPPPTCTNALDFSKACNSQYIPVVLR